MQQEHRDARQPVGHAPHMARHQACCESMSHSLQVGAALYGPQMLIGLCGAEAVSKTAVSAAQGFLG